MADRREALTQAFDKLESGDDDADETVVVDEVQGGIDLEQVAGSDDSELPGEGKKVEQKVEKVDEKQKGLDKSVDKGTQGKDAQGKKKSDGQVDPHEQERQANQQPTDKAPNSWKPAVREHWAKIPPEARAEISRREKEIQQSLSQTDGIRRFSNDLANVIAPHQDLIRAQNSTPLHAIDNLMKTASSLARGDARLKAHTVAQIIQNYGVDIKTLDEILSKGPIQQQGQPSPNDAPPAWARPMFQFMNEVQQTKQQRDQQMQETAQTAIDEAKESLPYFEDLQQEVADILEVNWRRGRTVTVKQAYDLAVNNNPDIKKLIPRSNGQSPKNQQNGNRSSVSQAASTLAKARRASSAVSGGPAGGDGKTTPKTRREALEQAFDDADG
jgi:hypothetical protein